jgi:hypothetical protein
MTQTVLGNEFCFDQNNYHSVMDSFVQDLKNLMKSSKTIDESIEKNSKIVDQVAVGYLLLLLSQDKFVPFGDNIWLNSFYREIEQRVFNQGTIFFTEHLKTLSPGERLVMFFLSEQENHN